MSDEEDLEYLLAYAREDWVGLSVIAAVAGAKAGEGATFAETTSVLLSVVDALIDHGAVPGDLLGEDRDFVAWQGSKSQVLARLACEIKALGEMPSTGEVCWIHRPVHRK
ncbi:hypothetical protein AB0N89_10125 [Amycolatopsis sp. NPDC089917]|uniref:hypothetical protein n=1 Tax=Amycolatopsis sp. NPDC089917 TaxID=3155187 RepID=UPI00341A7D4E